MQSEHNWTEQIAYYVTTTSINWDTELRNALYDGVLDWFSSVLSSKEDSTAEQLLLALGYDEQHKGVPSGCTVFGKSYKANALDAALINGYLAHALDYDDVHEEVRGHPSAVLLAALLAEAEHCSCSGKAFMEGYLIGMEVMCQLGKLIVNKHYELGWHSTSTLGAIAAAVAVGRMKGFTSLQLQHAIGLAATQAGGLRVHFGSSVKPLHAGIAARAGLLAARMAEAGITGAHETLTGKLGFLHMYSNGAVDSASLHIESWGRPWRMIEPGLWYKKYPCCSAAYHAIDAAHALWEKHQYAASEIASVRLLYPPGGDAALVIKQPVNGIEGRFSAEYIVAQKLVQAELSFLDFSEQAIDDEIKQLMSKITREHRIDIVASPEAMPKGRFTIVEVTKTDGSVDQMRCDYPTGSPRKPLSIEDKQYKFSAAIHGLDISWQAVPDRLLQLEQAAQVSELWRTTEVD